MKKLPCMTSPCKDCPCRKDTLRGWLGKKRAIEIVDSDSFVCHKTTQDDILKRKQCAGHMLLMQRENSFYALAKALDIPLGLTGEELIFASKQDFIDHHKN